VNIFPTNETSSKHKLYTQLAWIYDLIYPSIFNYQEQYNIIKESLQHYGIHSILEAMCGTGHLMRILESEAYSVTGLDLSQDMLDLARRRVKGDLLLQDVRDIQTEDRFDAVVCLGRGFTYMTTDMDVMKALRCLHRILEPDGILLLDNMRDRMFDPRGHSDWQEAVYEFDDVIIKRRRRNSMFDEENRTWRVDWVYEIKNSDETHEVKDKAVLRQFRWEQLKEQLQDSGFRDPQIIDEKSFTVLAQALRGTSRARACS